MRDSRSRILTSHAGSLPRPDDLIDDPAIAENWDMVTPEPTAADYRKFSPALGLSGKRACASRPHRSSEHQTGRTPTMAKSKKASARVTAAKQSQAATSAAARNKAGLKAIAKAAGQQTAGQQFEKTNARAIQAHIQGRGQRKQAKRDSR